MSEKPLCAIIGAGPGVSLGLARRFGRAGHRLALLSRSTPRSLAASLEAEGFDAEAVRLDAGDLAAVSQAVAALGRIDVLVWNAASATMSPPTAMSPDAFVEAFKVNAAGALSAVQAALPAMRTAGTGTILFTGGGFAIRPMAALFSLGVGKAAIRSLAFSLYDELQPIGVRVGTVTIMGMVEAGTGFDPDAIAEAFFSLHADRAGALGPEIQFMG